MTSMVLVHGAWGGSYGFRKVRPLLAAAGHEVFTPSLTGIGERSHLAGPDVGLQTHIQDVYNTIFYEDLTDIVLLGFSYGGMVVTGLIDQIADRVRHLVYLDALLPSDGQNALDVVGAPAQAWPHRRPPPGQTLAAPNQPTLTFTQRVSLATPLEDQPFTRTYIKASDDPGEPADSAFWQIARDRDASPAWNYHEIATNHMVPMMRPRELVDILLAL
nr:uncharacterized protein LOC133600722 [Nerophis lumbriciformis]